jgi:hypothetical protein
MVPFSEGTLKSMFDGVKDAESSLSSFTDYVKTAAQGLYHSFAPQIKAGIPTVHLLEPYRQVAKQMLGEQFEPDFVNDHKSMAVLSGSVDKDSGRAVPMTMDQWRQHIMSEPQFGWGGTVEANLRMDALLHTLRSGLGLHEVK